MLGVFSGWFEKLFVDSILLGEVFYLFVLVLFEYKNIYFVELNFFLFINFIRFNLRFLLIFLLNVLVIKNCYLFVLFIIEF